MEKVNVTPVSNETEEDKVTPVGIENDDDDATSVSQKNEDEKFTPVINEAVENNVLPVVIAKVDNNVTSVSHRKENENDAPVSHEKKDDKDGEANHATASHQTEASQLKDKADNHYKAVMGVLSFFKSVDPGVLRGGCFQPGNILKILEITRELKKADELMKYKETVKKEIDEKIKTKDEEVSIMFIESTEERMKALKILQGKNEEINKEQERQKYFVERNTIGDKMTNIIKEKMETVKEIMKTNETKEALNTELELNEDKERKRICDEVQKTEKETMTLNDDIKEKDEELKQYDEQMNKIDNQRMHIVKEMGVTKAEENSGIVDGMKLINDKIEKIIWEREELIFEQNQVVNEMKEINAKINKLKEELNEIQT